MQNNNPERSLLITGGAGFIGSHLVHRLSECYPQYQLLVFDKLTYAGDLRNLDGLPLVYHPARPVGGSQEGSGIGEATKNKSIVFIQGDICDPEAIAEAMQAYQIDGILHLAAESHVDRSIENPMEFVHTNVIGTVNLLHAALSAWGEHADRSKHLFYHISTDEVYGSLGAEGYFTEQTPYDPRSPYSASKAGSDHFVRAWHHTYGLPIVVSNCSNNYGPHQYPEKLIPVVIRQIRDRRPIPVYGKGENVRDWLWVGDHAAAIDLIFHEGQNGATYNIGGSNEWRNLDLVQLLCTLTAQQLGRAEHEATKLITFVTDRKGHDLRYAIDSSHLQDSLGWKPEGQFHDHLNKTIEYYLRRFDSEA
jgi:dTDP-glucose 4,6-dehydratase